MRTGTLYIESGLELHLPVKPAVLDQIAQDIFVEARDDPDAYEDEEYTDCAFEPAAWVDPPSKFMHNG